MKNFYIASAFAVVAVSAIAHTVGAYKIANKLFSIVDELCAKAHRLSENN